MVRATLLFQICYCTNLNVFLFFRHAAMLSVNLLADATAQALIPVLSLLVHTVMEMLQKFQLTTIHLKQMGQMFKCRKCPVSIFFILKICGFLNPNLEVLQKLDISGVVAIPLTPLEDSESAATHRFHIRASIRQQLQIKDLQHAAVIGKPEEHNTKRSYKLCTGE